MYNLVFSQSPEEHGLYDMVWCSEYGRRGGSCEAETQSVAAPGASEVNCPIATTAKHGFALQSV